MSRWHAYVRNAPPERVQYWISRWVANASRHAPIHERINKRAMRAGLKRDVSGVWLITQPNGPTLRVL